MNLYFLLSCLVDEGCLYSLQQMIHQEIQMWRRLRHPNILEFYGYCATSKTPFLVCALKKNRDALFYLQNCPDANRKTLVRISLIGG